MAYTFANNGGHRINVGRPPRGLLFSFYMRFLLNQDVVSTQYWLASFVDPTTSFYQFALLFANTATNRIRAFLTHDAGVGAEAAWTTGWATPSAHTLLYTYDGATIALYADGSATPKATTAIATNPDGGNETDYMDQELALGHYFAAPPPTTGGAPITLEEAGWWPGIAFTAAQAAAITSGNARGLPLPTNYWQCKANASDLFGVAHGVVTGASLVAHAGVNLYTVLAAKSLGAARLVGGGLAG